MTAIADLWEARMLPIRDGLFCGSGESYDVRLNAAHAGGLELLEEFSLDGFLRKNPDDLTHVDPISIVDIGSGLLCCGGGSWGSEGFFGRLDPDQNVEWIVYLEEANPFVSIEVDNDVATFRSSSGVHITVGSRSLTRNPELRRD